MTTATCPRCKKLIYNVEDSTTNTIIVATRDAEMAMMAVHNGLCLSFTNKWLQDNGWKIERLIK